MTARQIAATDIAATFFDHPGYISGNWYVPFPIGAFATGNTTTANQIRLVPGYVRGNITVNALGGRINTASAGGNVQFAIYANNPATGRPTGTALASTASISTTSTGSVNAAVSVTLPQGLYWFAMNVDNAVVILEAMNTIMAAYIIGSATQGNGLQSNTGISGVSSNSTFGTWPDLTAASFSEILGTIPITQFKVQ